MLKSISAHFGHCGPKPGRTLKNILTLFGPGFFPTPKERGGGGGGKIAHRHNSCISSQMKLKLGSNRVVILYGSCLPQNRKKS